MIDIEEYELIPPEPFDWSTFDRVKFLRWLRHPNQMVRGAEVGLWMRAVDHRHAWTCGRVLDYQSPEDTVHRYRHITHGVCAWVSPEGEVFPAQYASHDEVAEIIIGKMVHEIETLYARVSILCSSVEDFFTYVDRPTTKQRRAVDEHINQHLAHFGRLRDI